MFSKKVKQSVAVLCIIQFASPLVGFAENGPVQGFNLGNLNVSPFISASYMYDSNIYSGEDEREDSIYSINPGVDLTYHGNEWGVVGNAWYGYDYYQEYRQSDASRYGERLSFYRDSEIGWRFLAGQGFLNSSQNDSILDGGQGVWRDRYQIDGNVLLGYTFSERLAATLTGFYTLYDYQNNTTEFPANLYGWYEVALGLEVSRKITEKSNLLLNLSSQYYESQADDLPNVSTKSMGYSAQMGVGSRLTERIRYRIMAGANAMEAAESDFLLGASYSVDISWVMARQWAMTVAGSSYFQPSEYTVAQTKQVYAGSWGLTYKPFAKLTTGLDLAYRREDNLTLDGYENNVGEDYANDQISARLRGNYALHRYVSIFSNVESIRNTSDASNRDYDRVRITMGLSFRY